jgi:hypothetical protein
MPKEPTDMNRGELVAEVRKLRHLLARHMRGGETLWMESGVNDRGEPFVHMHWGDESGQLTTGEARMHATHMIEASAAADFDAALWAVFRRMDFAPEQARAMLAMMREERGQGTDASAVRK